MFQQYGYNVSGINAEGDIVSVFIFSIIALYLQKLLVAMLKLSWH